MSMGEIDYPNPGSHWWLVLLEGIVAVIVGIFLITNPASTLIFLVTFLGIYWLVTGVLNLITLFWNRSQWGWKLFTGIVGIIAGLLIIQNPLISTLVVPATFALVLGFLGLVIGIGQLIQAFRGGGWGVGVLGAVSILLGFLLIARPLVAGLTLAFLMGFLLVLGGILAFIAAFSLRSLSKHYKEEEARAAHAVEQAGSTVPGTAPLTGDFMAGVAGAGAAGVVSMDTAKRMDEDISDVAGAAHGHRRAAGEDIAGDVATGAAGVAGAGMDAARQTDEDISDVAGAGMDTAERMGEDVVGGVTGALIGNVNPLDTQEMAKFKYPLEYLEGIGPAYADKLKAIGIVNCLDLIKAGSTAKGRNEIVQKSGINGDLILEWVNHVDLYRIQGVGSEYADLLEASGVDTVVELAQRNPANLFEKLNSINQEKHLVRQLPIQSQVENWVAQANELPRVITY